MGWGAAGGAGARAAGERGRAWCTCASAMHSRSEASLPIRAVPYEYLRKLSIMPCAAVGEGGDGRLVEAKGARMTRMPPARCASWPPS